MKPAREKAPPPVPPKTIVGHPLPGMVPSDSDQPSGGVAQRIKLWNEINEMDKEKIWKKTYKTSPTSGFHGFESERTAVTEKIAVNPSAEDPKLGPDPMPFNRTPECGTKGFSLSSLKRIIDEAQEDEEDYENLMEWWHTVKSWDEDSNDLSIPKKQATQFRKKVRRLKKALILYDYLLSDRKDALYALIDELKDVAQNLDKVFKRAKIAGITGGTAGAAGVAAAVGGIILAPLTMGASLAVTAVGVGVAAAGGVTGASAAITNKVSTTMDRKKVEKILSDYTAQMKDIEGCVEFINTGVDHLRSYRLSEMDGVNKEAEKVVKVVQVAMGNTGAIGAISKSSGLIQGFAVGMDLYFSKDDDQKLQKGSETKFAKQIRHVAKQMEASLNALMKARNSVASADV